MKASLLSAGVFALIVSTVFAGTYHGAKYSCEWTYDGILKNIAVNKKTVLGKDSVGVAFFLKKDANGKTVLGRSWMFMDYKNPVKVERKEKSVILSKSGTLHETNTKMPLLNFTMKKTLAADSIHYEYEFTQICEMKYNAAVVTSHFEQTDKPLLGLSVKAVRDGKIKYTAVPEQPGEFTIAAGNPVTLTADGVHIVFSGEKNVPEIVIGDQRVWKAKLVQITFKPGYDKSKKGIFPAGTVWKWSYTVRFE